MLTLKLIYLAEVSSQGKCRRWETIQASEVSQSLSSKGQIYWSYCTSGGKERRKQLNAAAKYSSEMIVQFTKT